MRRTLSLAGLGAVLIGSPIAAPDLICGAVAQEARIAESAVTLSSGGRRAELWIELSDGREHRIAFESGSLRFDEARLGRYAEDGDLASGWRDFLRDRAGADPASVQAGLLALLEELPDWAAASEADAAAAQALEGRLRSVFGLESTTPAEGPRDEPAAGRALQIAPGGLEFDFTRALGRLTEALERLGPPAEGVSGRLGMIVHDDFSLPAGSSVDGSLALLDGTLRLAGQVAGDVLVLDGTLVLEDGARIGGNVLQVGGDVTLEGADAAIAGEILSDLPLSAARGEAPEAPTGVQAPPRPSRRAEGRSSRGPDLLGRLSRNVSEAAEDLVGVLSTLLVLGVLGLAAVYFTRKRLETVSDTVRHEFGRSFVMGLAGQVLFFPALLVLLVLVITWPVVPFFVLGTGLAGVLGYLAVAHGAGEMFADRRFRYRWLERLRRSNSYYYVWSGLVVLLLPFAAVAVLWVLGDATDVLRDLITFAACVATWILVTAGFGGVLLTRAGSRSVVVDWRTEPVPDLGDVPPEPGAAPPGPQTPPAGTGGPEDADA